MDEDCSFKAFQEYIDELVDEKFIDVQELSRTLQIF